MLSIVTDPETDYVFVTDFNVLEDHLDNLLQQACRPMTTSSTPASTTTSALVDPEQSSLQILRTFLTFTGDMNK